MTTDTPVFISYRRNPSVEFARTIHYALNEFNIKSFFDYTSIRDGHFNENIFKAIDDCNYLFLIIMDNSLDKMADDPNDWVRKELEYAIDKGKTIVPIVYGSHKRLWPEKLPEKLECLRSLQISKIDNEDYFEMTLRQVLLDRTTLLKSVDDIKPSQLKGDVFTEHKHNIRLSKAMAIGFNLPLFCIRYIQKKSNKKDLECIKSAQPGILIPFPNVHSLSATTMMDYLEKCVNVMKNIFGESAGNATRFGIYFHLSEIAKRNDYNEDIAHSYDESLISAGKYLGLPDNFLQKIVKCDGADMMDYYEAVKKII